MSPQKRYQDGWIDPGRYRGGKLRRITYIQRRFDQAMQSARSGGDGISVEPEISICGSASDPSDPPVCRTPLSFLLYVGRMDIWARTSVMSSRPSWPRRENYSPCCFSGTCQVYFRLPFPPVMPTWIRNRLSQPLHSDDPRSARAFDAREPQPCHLCTTMRPLHP